ncbi:hypothetical protein L3Q82_011503 [Scortum barcoo]|uniref:Uncharacterized protein n=1 Tax=Scortum barcoo TaxID=214431 RepID=A0ACB8W5I2_9TELE|nr:hypothetical protein L3Q82_011503 [Scortum barcoo]
MTAWPPNSSNTIIKFADDTTVSHWPDHQATMRRPTEEEVRALTSWCQDNNLHLNVSKTKELIVDFRRRQREEHTPLSINGTTVESQSQQLQVKKEANVNPPPPQQVRPQLSHDDSQVCPYCTHPVHTRTVRRWTQEATEAQQDYFESTDWDVLCEPHGEDIDNMTDCITEYIRFCEDTTVPAQTVHCFSNNKPWITRDLKALLNKKKMSFQGWRQRGAEESAARTQRHAEDMQGQLQEEAGG